MHSSCDTLMRMILHHRIVIYCLITVFKRLIESQRVKENEIERARERKREREKKVIDFIMRTRKSDKPCGNPHLALTLD